MTQQQYKRAIEIEESIRDLVKISTQLSTHTPGQEASIRVPNLRDRNWLKEVIAKRLAEYDEEIKNL